MTPDGKPETLEEWQADLRAHSEDMKARGWSIPEIIQYITVIVEGCDPQLWAEGLPHYLDAQRAERDRLIKQLS